MSPFGPRKVPTRVRRKTYEKPEDIKKDPKKLQKKKFGDKVNTDMQSAIQYSVEQRREYPSVVEQSRKSGYGFQWIRGEFLLPGPRHYNPGLIERSDGLWMAYRDQDQFGDSRIGVCRLAGDECLPEENRKIELPDHFGRLEQREDPRLFWLGGAVWMSYVCWNRKRTAAIALVRLSGDWEVMEEIRTEWGDNWGPMTFQKNWAFFNDNTGASSHFRMIYYPSPHEVVAIARDGTGRLVVREKGVQWQWGLARGGSPPVFYDGRYWSFFHSRLMTPGARFRYFAGAYAFSAVEDHVPQLVSVQPLLAASDDDPNIENLPLAVFPCGAVLRNGEWWVSLGVNDTKCAILRIDHERLRKGMVACS